MAINFLLRVGRGKLIQLTLRFVRTQISIWSTLKRLKLRSRTCRSSSSVSWPPDATDFKRFLLRIRISLRKTFIIEKSEFPGNFSRLHSDKSHIGSGLSLNMQIFCSRRVLKSASVKILSITTVLTEEIDEIAFSFEQLLPINLTNFTSHYDYDTQRIHYFYVVLYLRTFLLIAKLRQTNLELLSGQRKKIW